MKNKKITTFLIVLIFLFIFIFIASKFFGHSHVVLNSNCNISNIGCTREFADEFSFNKNDFYHESSIYGLYRYHFEIDVNGERIPVVVDFMKTNAKKHNSINISVTVEEVDGIYSATLVVNLDGKMKSIKIDDISKDDLYIKVGI